jgi:hypothetical protein
MGNMSEKKKNRIEKEIMDKSNKSAETFTEEFFSEFTEFDKSMDIGHIFSIVKEQNLIKSCASDDSKFKHLIRLVNYGFYLFNYENDLVFKL